MVPTREIIHGNGANCSDSAWPLHSSTTFASSMSVCMPMVMRVGSVGGKAARCTIVCGGAAGGSGCIAAVWMQCLSGGCSAQVLPVEASALQSTKTAALRKLILYRGCILL